MKKLFFLFILLLLVSPSFVTAKEQTLINEDFEVKREARAVWVSPLTSDISRFSTKEKYQKEVTKILDTMEEYNLNILIFHIRIMNDALYESVYSNWSSYYNTNPSWEALPWVIEECHKRGIEFHAWMNPYRVTTSVGQSKETIASKFPKSNPASNPNNLLKGSSTVILNPGIPEVQNFLVNVVMEVVRKYNIDAIHFDDYFYIEGMESDLDTYSKYGVGQGIKQFRRDSIDKLIKSLDTEIERYNQENNTCIELGISPTAAWQNGSGKVEYDENGFAISDGSLGITQGHYDDYLYCDTLKWVNEGWIDYIIPQCYPGTSEGNNLFYGTVEWWDKVVKNSRTKLYIGIGLYRASATGDWKDNDELNRQFTYMANYQNVEGFSIFKYSNLTSSNQSMKNNLQNAKSYFSEKVLAPVIDIECNEEKIENNFYIINDGNKHTIGVRQNNYKYYVIFRNTNGESKFIAKTGLDEEFVDYFDGDVKYYVMPVLNNNKLGSYEELTSSDDYFKVTYQLFDESIITWYFKNEEDIVFPSVKEYEGYNFLGFVKEDENYKYVANYEIKKCKVTYLVNDEVYKEEYINYGDELKLIDFDTTGGKFSGWKGKVNNVYEDIIITATFIKNKYTVQIFNGEQLIDKLLVEYGTILKLDYEVEAKEGYVFVGFSTFGEIVEKIEITKTINLYAAFEKITFTVEYDLDGGKVEGVLKTKLDYNENIKLPIPTKEGYTFLYYINVSTNEKVEEVCNQNISVKAVYSKLSFVVTINNDGNITTVMLDYNEEYVLEELFKEGYEFIGYFDGNRKIEKVINENVTLETKYVKLYVLTLDLNGGMLELSTLQEENYFKDGKDIILPNCSKEGYEFIGWFDGDIKVTNIGNQDTHLVARFTEVKKAGCNNLSSIYLLVSLLGILLIRKRRSI